MRTSMVYAMLAAVLVGMGCNESTPLPTSFTATLSGAGEVPANSSPGAATATIRLDGLTLKYTLNITAAGFKSYTAAHIHTGAAGASGPVRVPICGGTRPACPTATGTVTDSVTVTSGSDSVGGITFDSLVTAMVGFGAYVNVHSDSLPAGEIRGQVFPRP